jgi:UDP-N-acetylmuramoyl-L-alanyl-D-glutamate--2,6-diaminopimelate ligase
VEDESIAGLRASALAAALGATLWGVGEDPVVTGIAMDHRLVEPGDVFAVVPGQHFDPRGFVTSALERGARALLVGEVVPCAEVPQLVVAAELLRPKVAEAASVVFGAPSRRLRVVGVTGTNGKTTTVQLVAELLALAGEAVGTVGTLWGRLTTPEAPELERRLSQFLREGCGYVAMEVSSIALVQSRVDAISFEAAVFTNLTQDHLDVHGTMERYFEAKARLFEAGRARAAIINTDDPYGARLAGLTPLPVVPVSMTQLSEVVLGPNAMAFRWRGQRVAAPLVGAHNLMNLATALTVMEVLGFAPSAMAELARDLQPPRGRLERVPSPVGTIFVDYAHSPAALEAALGAARLSVATGGRLGVVFGAGGERDHGKRPMMGRVVEKLSDWMIITSDNPRSEDPAMIATDIVAGLGEPRAATVILDRREAIREAVARLAKGDVLVIAGKGHERTQRVGDRVLDFDDYEEALAAVELVMEGRS